MTDSSSQSDDTSCGGGSRNGRSGRSSTTNQNTTRRRKGVLNAKERNLRRLESNERERMRMHSLNDAFQVKSLLFILFIINFYLIYISTIHIHIYSIIPLISLMHNVENKYIFIIHNR